MSTTQTPGPRRLRARPAYRAPAPLGGRSGRQPSRGRRRELRRSGMALAFLLPALVILGAFVVWPMISALRLSFTNAAGFGVEEWVGIDNYVKVFTEIGRASCRERV